MLYIEAKYAKNENKIHLNLHDIFGNLNEIAVKELYFDGRNDKKNLRHSLIWNMFLPHLAQPKTLKLQNLFLIIETSIPTSQILAIGCKSTVPNARHIE